MKRPSFQFYPADWLGNSNLRRCTHQEKGVWIDLMCLLHDQEEYGVLRWPLVDIARAVGCDVECLRALIAKGVLKGGDANEACQPYVYTPRTGRRDGDPVTLIAQQEGPIWYSSRMVRDEYVREHRGESARFQAMGESFGDAPKAAPKPPIGEGLDAHQTLHPTITPKVVQQPIFLNSEQECIQSTEKSADSTKKQRKTSPKPPFGDGSSSSSSSSSSLIKREANSTQTSSASPPVVKTNRKKQLTFQQWAEQTKASGEKLISASQVWSYAQSIGLPDSFVDLAWFKFKARYLGDPRYRTKTYADWRAVFRNAVESNWFGLWVAREGGFRLTTVGEQASRELDASLQGAEVPA